MVKLTIGGGDTERIEWPTGRGVVWYLQPCELLSADDKYRQDRLKWPFEAISGIDDEFVGKVFNIYTNMPTGNTVSTRSNLYAVLEGVSGSEFEPGDEIDTSEYEGKYYTGDLKREQAQENVGTQDAPKFQPKFVDGKPVKKTVLKNLFPTDDPTERTRPQRQQSGYKWSEDDDDE